MSAEGEKHPENMGRGSFNQKRKIMKEAFKKAGYSYIKFLGSGEHLLENEDGKLEIWFANKNHGSYGLIYKNTHLEFVRLDQRKPDILSA